MSRHGHRVLCFLSGAYDCFAIDKWVLTFCLPLSKRSVQHMVL